METLVAISHIRLRMIHPQEGSKGCLDSVHVCLCAWVCGHVVLVSFSITAITASLVFGGKTLRAFRVAAGVV